MRAAGSVIAYLRLPPRTVAGPLHEDEALPLPYAFAARSKLLQTGVATLDQIADELAAAHTVVLLMAASDVTLLQVAVPPLPAHRLPQVLPALIEDRLIGDTADCVIVAGEEIGGQRLVAVAQRDWLQHWIARLRASGARRLRALPVQCCLPVPDGALSAALMVSGYATELVIRYNAAEGIGLPLTDADDVTLPDQVFQALATLAGERPVLLELPEDFISEFESALASERHAVRIAAMQPLHWPALIELAAHAGPDLIAGMQEAEITHLRWQRWRWPLRLAVLLLVVNLAALQADSWRLQREAASLQAGMTNTYRQAFPNDTVVVDPLAQLQQKITDARRRAGEAAPGDFLALAAAFGDVWHPLQTDAGIGTQSIAGVSYRDQTLEVRFRPEVQPPVDAAHTALAAHALQLRTSQAENGARLWQVRSAP